MNSRILTYELIGSFCLKKKNTKAKAKQSKNPLEVEFTSFSQILLHHMLEEISVASVLHTWRQQNFPRQ
jgi:hypothetical protein